MPHLSDNPRCAFAIGATQDNNRLMAGPAEEGVGENTDLTQRESPQSECLTTTDRHDIRHCRCQSWSAFASGLVIMVHGKSS